MPGGFPIFTINPVGMAEIMRGPDGPVMKEMIVLGERVKVATIASLKPGFPQQFLGPTIVKRFTATGSGPEAAVGVVVGSEHTKTQPHQIVGNPWLAFEWPKVGPGVFFFHSVNHPGSDFTNPTPNHPEGYLPEKLRLALEAVRPTI